MNIPLQKLLAKMDTELQGAKQAKSDAAIRERVYSLKTLCELVLDEPVQEKVNMFQAPEPVKMPVQTPMQVPLKAQPSLTNEKKLEIDDANGDSLWDF